MFKAKAALAASVFALVVLAVGVGVVLGVARNPENGLGPDKATVGNGPVSWLSSQKIGDIRPYFAWSADSRQVLLPFFSGDGASGHPALLLVELADRRFTTKVVVDDLTDPDAIVAWRPDGKVVATLEEPGSSRLTPMLRLFSVPDFREIARRPLGKGTIDDLAPSPTPRALAFTADGASLWVATRGGQTSPPYRERVTLALQLDGRDLRTLDHLDVDVPIAGQRVVFGSTPNVYEGGTILESTPQGLRLTALLHSFSRTPGTGDALVDVESSFVYGINLETQRNLFSPFKIPVDNASRTNRIANAIQLSLDSKILLVGMSGPKPRFDVPESQDSSQDRRYDAFDMTTGGRLSKFGGVLDSTRDDYEGEGVDGSITPDGRLLVYAATVTKSVDKDEPVHVTVFDLATGEIIQRLPAPSSAPANPFFISMSPDGKYLLALAGHRTGGPVTEAHLFSLRY